MPSEATMLTPAAMPGEAAMLAESCVPVRKAVAPPTMIPMVIMIPVVLMIPVVITPATEPAIAVYVIAITSRRVTNGLGARGQAKTHADQP